jgi:hypothetical protein
MDWRTISKDDDEEEEVEPLPATTDDAPAAFFERAFG